VDFSAEQLQIAERSARAAGLTNIRFREATAYETGLSQESFDLVFSRFLMCHLTEPLKALLEMRRILKTGGILVCEDHDDAGVFTEPPTNAYKRLAEISAAVNRANGLDSSIGLKLPRMVCEAGFQQIEVRVKQLPFLRGFAKRFWEITLREAKPAILATKATTPEELESLCSEMRAIARDESILTYVGSHHSSVGSKVKAESVATPCLRENDGPERNVPGRILSAPNGTGATAWSA